MRQLMKWLIFAMFLICLQTVSSPAGQPGQGENGPSFAQQALEREGENLFSHYCAHCHGTSGDGDGFNADYLDKEPAELSDSGFISKKTNDQIFRVIQLGGTGVRKSHLMPKFGNTLSERDIWALVAYIRKLAQDNTHPVTVPEDPSSIPPENHLITSRDLESFSKWFSSKGNNKETIKSGDHLFHKKKSCFACHQMEEEGGRVGPDLSRSGINYRPEWIYAWISNPQQFRPKSPMPNLGLDSGEAGALAAYLHQAAGEDEFPEDWKEYLETPGDPERGKKMFFDPEGTTYCSKCHRVGSEGGHVGPDLSLIGFSRTDSFILESILDPKAVITSGYSTMLILTKKRKFITGIKRNEDDRSIDLVDKEGNLVHIPKSEIKKFKTQKISIMPGNFKDLLTVQEVADILAYLKTLTPPQMVAVAGSN